MFPRKWNPVDIVIKQAKTAAQVIDPDLDEPAGPRLYDTPDSGLLTLRGQVNFGSKMFERQTPSLAGDNKRTTGHLLFRVPDLEDAGVVLEEEDIIVMADGRELNEKIIELRPESPLRGNFQLLYAVFEHNRHIRGSQ